MDFNFSIGILYDKIPYTVLLVTGKTVNRNYTISPQKNPEQQVYFPCHSGFFAFTSYHNHPGTDTSHHPYDIRSLS